jgi:hypothetical protein
MSLWSASSDSSQQRAIDKTLVVMHSMPLPALSYCSTAVTGRQILLYCDLKRRYCLAIKKITDCTYCTSTKRLQRLSLSILYNRKLTQYYSNVYLNMTRC